MAALATARTELLAEISRESSSNLAQQGNLRARAEEGKNCTNQHCHGVGARAATLPSGIKGSPEVCKDH